MREFEGTRAYGRGSDKLLVEGDSVIALTGVALYKVVDRKSTMRTALGSRSMFLSRSTICLVDLFDHKDGVVAGLMQSIIFLTCQNLKPPGADTYHLKLRVPHSCVP